MNPEIKRSIILDNYQEPRNRGIPSNKDGYIKINSNNDYYDFYKTFSAKEAVSKKKC